MEASKIRVMHVITDLTAGGAQAMLLKLLAASSRDFQHIVVSLAEEGVIGSRISALGIPVYSLGLRPRLPNPLRLLSIRAVTRRFRPQLIQGWMPHGNLAASMAGVFSSIRTNVLWNVRMALYSLRAERRLNRRERREARRLQEIRGDYASTSQSSQC